MKNNARTIRVLSVLLVGLCCMEGALLGQSQDPVLVGAGDIADCNALHTQGPLARAQQTASLLDSISGTVFAAGDLAYPDASDGNFAKCYDATWGRHRARTIPTTGNHEYFFPGAVDYFNYWGPVAGDPAKGYYSLDLGTWHIVVLNSNCAFVSCTGSSAQVQWLQADLAAHPATCTLAIFHHPLFSSTNFATPAVKPFWQALYSAGADLVVDGHAHNYERFAPQDPNGIADSTRGIREFVVGTGGDSRQSFGMILPNSEVRDSSTYGVLKLTLHPTSYDWQFIPIPSGTFTDSGTGSCH